MLVSNDLTKISGKTTLSESIVTLIGKTSPFAGNSYQTVITPGLTIAQMVGETIDDDVIVLFNDLPVPRDQWANITPKTGAVITVARTAQGDNPIRTLLTVAIVVGVAAYAGPAGISAAQGLLGTATLGAGGTLLAGAITASIYLASGLLIAAMYPPEKPDTQSSYKAGRYNAITGGGNGIAAYAPIPKHYGTLWNLPPLAAMPYTEALGKDQYFNGLYALGYGGLRVAGVDLPLGFTGTHTVSKSKGVLNNPSSIDLSHIRLGDTTLNNFDDFELELAYQAGSSLFREGTIETAVNAQFLTTGTTFTRTTSPDTQDVNFDIVFPQGLYSMNDRGKYGDAGYLLGFRITSSNYSVHGVTTKGNVRLHSDGNVYYQPTVRAKGNYTDSFTVTWNTSDGETTTWYEDQYVINWSNTGGFATITSMTVNTLPYTGFVNGMYWTGDINVYKVEYSPTGLNTWSNVQSIDPWLNGMFQVSGNRDPFAQNIGFRLPSKGQWDIRITEHLRSGRHTYYRFLDSTWSVLRSIRTPREFKPTNVVLAAIRIKSSEQLSGNLPEITFKVTSLLDNGEGTVIPTGNVALCYLDALRGVQNTHPVPDNQIDIDSILAWRDWCTTNNFNYNWIHASEETVLQRIQAICATGFANWTMIDGRFGVVTDLNITPTHVITPRNSSGFSLRKQYIDLPHAFRVRYLDVEKREEVERTVYADGYDETTATKFESLDTQGITDAAHAFKFGRYHLANAILRPEIYTVTQSAESLVVERGDVARLSYDVMLTGTAWGRIKSFTTTTVTLDDPVPIQLGKTYAITLRHGDGSQSIIPVTGAVGFSSTLDWSAPPVGTNVGDLVVFGESGKMTIDAKVTSITPNPDLTATLVLVPAAPEIYDAWTGAVPPFDPVITTPIDRATPLAPVILTVESTEDMIYQSATGTYESGVTVSWTLQDDPVPVDEVKIILSRLAGYIDDTRYDVANTEYYTVNAGIGTYYFDNVIESDYYRVQLAAISTTGRMSLLTTPVIIQAFDVEALIASITPPVITSVESGTDQLVKLSDGTIITRAFVQWSNTTSLGMEGYDVWYRQLGATEWNTLQVVSDTLYTYINNLIDGVAYDIQVRSLYRLGIKSDWATVGHTAVGKTQPPSDVTGLVYTYNKGVYTLRWNDIADLDRDAYVIKKNGIEVTRLRSTSYDAVDVTNGINTYDVYAVDTTGNISLSPATTSFTIVVNAPVITSIASGTEHLLIRQDGSIDVRALLQWTGTADTYEVRWARVADGVYQSTTTSQTSIYIGNLTEADQYTFEVRALGEVIGTHSSWTTIAHIVIGKTQPPSDVQIASVVLEDRTIVLNWEDIPDADRFEYEIRKGTVWDTADFIARVGTTSWSRPADTVGVQTWLVKAIDTSNLYSLNAKAITITIEPPNQPSVTAQVVDNNVLIKFSATEGTLPIDYYRVERTGVIVGTVKGNFTVIIESEGGEYTYNVYALDIAGNTSSAGQFTVRVGQPPDYVLNADFDSDFSGTLTNGVVDNNYAIVPVNTGETWGDYLTATTTYSTLQDEINAGFTNWLTPHNNSVGSYVEVYDYGAALGSSLITITPTVFRSIGAQSVVPKIDVSLDGVSWIEYDGVWSVYAVNFRYVRFTGTETPTDNKSQTIYSRLNFRLDAKLKNDAGTDTITNATTGKTVTFTTPFTDITSLVVTPMTTTPVLVAVDFVDTPYPTEFTVYLYDLTGVQVTGNFSWAAKGY